MAGTKGDLKVVPTEVQDSIRRALVVHRSGTSAVTRVLNLRGAALPQTLMPPQEDNPG